MDPRASARRWSESLRGDRFLDIESGIDQAIARIAARQRGLITREQLLALGLSPGGIESRVRRGRLHRVQRGVYLVGHAVPPPFARELAAVLVCGAGTFVTGCSALGLWDIDVPDHEVVHVVVVGRRVVSRAGLHVRTTERLAPADRSRRHGIPVTAAARALVDAAGGLGRDDLEGLVNEVQVRRRASATAIRNAAERAGPVAGTRRLRELVDGTDRGVTRNGAERRLRAALRGTGLPAPETNVRLRGVEVDALWREQRVVVEFDGFAAHGTRRAFESDRARDARLLAAGYRVMRVTWRQLRDEPEVVAARLGAVLNGRMM